MRRTLSVLVVTAALLTPAAGASASTRTANTDAGNSPSNASCSNGKGGNSANEYNGEGNTAKAASHCMGSGEIVGEVTG